MGNIASRKVEKVDLDRWDEAEVYTPHGHIVVKVWKAENGRFYTSVFVCTCTNEKASVKVDENQSKPDLLVAVLSEGER